MCAQHYAQEHKKIVHCLNHACLCARLWFTISSIVQGPNPILKVAGDLACNVYVVMLDTRKISLAMQAIISCLCKGTMTRINVWVRREEWLIVQGNISISVPSLWGNILTQKDLEEKRLSQLSISGCKQSLWKSEQECERQSPHTSSQEQREMLTCLCSA